MIAIGPAGTGKRVCAEGCGRFVSRWRLRCRRCARMIDLHLRLSLYWSNLDVAKAIAADRRQNKKLDGLCQDCPAPSLPDCTRCAVCRVKNNATSTVRARRRNRALAREVAAYRPLDEVIDLTRVRVLRALVRLEWVSCSDLIDTLGGVDDTMRNTISQQLTRLAKSGHVEKRRIPPLTGSGYGAQWEYQIAQKGRANLDEIMRGGGRKFLAGKRAA